MWVSRSTVAPSSINPLTDLLDLEATREAMINAVVGGMPDEHRRFLVTFKRGEPDWSLLGLPAVAELPAVKFRQQKLAELSTDVRAAQLERLEQVLFAGGSQSEGPDA